MKKLFTSALMMVATLVASAQSFTVTAFGEETPIKDGETITCGYTEMGPNVYEWDPELTVTVTADMTVVVSASANETFSDDGVSILSAQLCPNGSCQALTGNITKSSTAVLTAGASLDLDLHMLSMSQGKLLENMPVKVQVFANGKEVNFTVIFTPDEQTEAGINGVSAAANRVSLSHRTLNYSVESTANLTLYTISGQSAISRRVSGNGSINLSDLPSGVYIYSLGSKTGKLIIR